MGATPAFAWRGIREGEESFRLPEHRLQQEELRQRVQPCSFCCVRHGILSVLSGNENAYCCYRYPSVLF